MSNEQNIDDIVKLLRDSVTTEPQTSGIDGTADGDDISSELLQETLKSKFMTDGAPEASDATATEYVIDDDFLSEVNGLAISYEGSDEQPVTLGVENETVDPYVGDSGNESFSKFEAIEFEELLAAEDDTVISQDIYESDQTKDLAEAEISDDEVSEEYNEAANVSADEAPENNTDVLIATMRPTYDEPIAYDEELSDDEYEFTEQEQLYADISLEDIQSLAQVSNDEFSPADTIIISPEMTPDTLREDTEETPVQTEEKHETFLASMRKSGIDFTTDDIYNSSVAASDDEPADKDEEAPVKIPADEEIDLSTINLMMQFCEKEEIEETIGNERVDDFLRFEDSTVNDTPKAHVAKGREYVSAEQNESILASYRKKRFNSLISFVGILLIAVIAFIYELMPLVGLRAGGIFDYEGYPAIYALIGLQFVVFAAAIFYKQIWNGLKRAFSLTPNTYSIAAIVMALTALYDVIIIIVLSVSTDDLPPLYNAVAVLVCALCSMADYLDVYAEMKAFSVYSSDERKYTLVKEGKDGAVASKMYSGGLDEEKNVYSAHSLDFPNGFFRSIEKTPNTNKILSASIIPVLILGIIGTIISVLLGADAYGASAAFMVCVYIILPVALIVSDVIPYFLAMIKLSKRTSAFAGRNAIEKYSDCDVMVFNDLHIFKKCKTEDVGIVIYDTGVGYLTLGCLDALYSRIGGPLSGMKIDLPEVFKFNNVSLRRITRNGIEAVIDRKHTLIVGEPSYLEHYGLKFPENEQENTERMTLCVSLGGKVTAKLSVKYEVEPIFEMLVERLAAEGISSTIQTYDPLINGAMVARSRTLGSSPISVVHKNVDDFNNAQNRRYTDEEDAVISCSSRLKLVETAIWLKKLFKVKKICEWIALGFSALGLITSILLIALGITGAVNQMYVLLYLLLEAIAIAAPMITIFPNKKYFTQESVCADLQKKKIGKND